jgi:hypothetical protein
MGPCDPFSPEILLPDGYSGRALLPDKGPVLIKGAAIEQ